MHRIEIPEEYKVTGGWRTISHAQFYYFVAQDNKRILIFKTQDNIRYLSANTTLFGDGTFKTVPTQFIQLFTVHDAVLGYTMTLIYALTMKR